MPAALLHSQLPGLTPRCGKVRDVYDFGERLLIVATDRLSAFDWVLPTGIPDKGRVLTQLSKFWFEKLGLPNHLISTNPTDVPLPRWCDISAIEWRSMVVRATRVVPFECVVRGYLSGSAWKDYQRTGSVCGIALPHGLRESDKLPEPIFTPTTKATAGHDESITFEQLAEQTGQDLANRLRDFSLQVYRTASTWALSRGIIIADTKFEFGETTDDTLLLIDEVLTPDSSRFWPAQFYRPGQSQPSFDKQYVRDWLESTRWDKQSTPPALPNDVVEVTREKYLEAYERLTGSPCPLPDDE